MHLLNSQIFKISCIFYITLFFQFSSYGQPEISKTEKLENLFSKYVEHKDFNGSVLIAEEGEVIYKKGFGLSNMELNTKNRTDTKHRLASISKQFTSMLTLQLVASGLINLHDPISKYITQYPKEKGDQITIHHLLTHTSGIPNYTSFQGYGNLMTERKTPIEIIDFFADSTLHFKPGDQFNYSNSGYVLLGYIIEEVTGKSYEENLIAKIFSPLKMKNSGLDNSNKIIKGRSSGYYKSGRSYENANYIDMSVAFSAGGIYSTVEDLFLWEQSLSTEKLLPKKYMDMLFEKHVPAWGKFYGYGWAVGEMNIGNTKQKFQAFDHSGDINGYKSFIVRIPESKSAIILLSNISGAPLFDIANAITGIIYNTTYDFPKKSFANSMAEKIDNHGIESAISFFKTHKKSDKYNISENEINFLGYEFLNKGEIEKAIKIFKINIEAFPGSSNAYDSFAEAQMLAGNNKEAIENYKKSIELNPRNNHGIGMLQKLGIDTDQITEQYFYFLETEENWRREIFHFPLHFASDINHTGLEDARFPKGWAVKENEAFWSYVFAWKIQKDYYLDKNELEDNLEKYFDGLMRIENKIEDSGVNKTSVSFQKMKSASENSNFTGKVETYDAFFNHKMMTLNVTVEQKLVKENNELIIIYRFSPKSFESNIWNKLNSVRTSNQ